jgi:hypothetical protein
MFGLKSSGVGSQAAHASATAQIAISEFVFITGSVRQIAGGNGNVAARKQVFVTMRLAYDAGSTRRPAEHPRETK